MASPSDTTSMALFCDFENIALGVRDAKYEKFDIRPVLERLLAKGSIVVKKAYCDWERYKAFKATMHEANFELIEIPHVRQSGKNSADIRMVVDALDLCYTKAHVDTFVIISGDSDFSPLVSKLRENAKQVIGVGVKQSTSDLLIANCDEFIFYDDLVREREAQRTASRREQPPRRSPEEERQRREESEARRDKAVELVVATFEDLMAVRGDAERIWASVVKEAIKRRNPGFNESYFGYKTFGALLEDAAVRGRLGVGRDEKSGTFVTRAIAKATATPEAAAPEILPEPLSGTLPASDAGIPPAAAPATLAPDTPPEGTAATARRRGSRGGRQAATKKPAPATSETPAASAVAEAPAAVAAIAAIAAIETVEPVTAPPAPSRKSPAKPRAKAPARPRRKKAEASAND